MPVSWNTFDRKILKMSSLFRLMLEAWSVRAHFAKRLDAELAIVDKRRPKANVADVMNVIGDVEGKTAILLDDMVDTAGTFCKDAEALKKFGAVRV